MFVKSLSSKRCRVYFSYDEFSIATHTNKTHMPHNLVEIAMPSTSLSEKSNQWNVLVLVGCPDTAFRLKTFPGHSPFQKFP